MSLEERIKQQNDYCGVTHWHEKGYKGQGVTVWNCEKQNDSHGKGTAKRVLDAAPECNLVTGSISLTVGIGGKEVTRCGVYDDDGNYHEINDWITKNNVKVITCSLYNVFKDKDTAEGDFWQNLIDKYGLIIINCAGNEGNKNFDFSKKVAWYIGALYLDNTGKPKRHNYSSTGEGIDFADFTERNGGTSCAAPYFAGKCALVLQKHPDFKPSDVYNYMKFCSMDLETDGEDIKTGHGLPLLPLILDGGEKEEDMAKKTTFNDVPEGAWYEDAVAYCVEKGYMKGISETEFKPEQPLTRAQMAQVLMNVFGK